MVIESNLSADIILAILAANFEATKVPNINGDLPLHTAIEYKLPEEVIICILAANIDAAKVLDKSGTLPLRKAVENNLSDKVILAILKGNEDAVKTKQFCDMNSVSYGVKSKEITNASIKPTNKDYSEKDICEAIQSKLSEILTHFSLVGNIDYFNLSEKVASALDALKIVCESLKTSDDMDGVHMINDAEVPIGHSILSSDRNENEVTVVPVTSVHEEINDGISCDETLESYGVLSLT
jgi:ankyrin repeat protein